MNWLWFAVYALATFRLTHFIVFDALVEGWRERVGITIAHELDQSGNVVDEMRCVAADARFPKLAEFLNCHYCVSFWVGLLFAVCAKFQFNIDLTNIIPLALSFSAISIFLELLRMATPTPNKWWK